MTDMRFTEGQRKRLENERRRREEREQPPVFIAPGDGEIRPCRFIKRMDVFITPEGKEVGLPPATSPRRPVSV